MARRKPTKLPAPFLRRVWVDADIPTGRGYPFDLPWLSGDFDIAFSEPVTIFMGENGSGKSSLIEAIAALCGFDEAGGGAGYRPVDHSEARETNGAGLSRCLRAGWLPKVGEGWFFRAETFFSVARYLDAAGSGSADFLSHSHGEGFLRLIAERMSRTGIYLLDEPESALSPRRQVELLRFLAEIQSTGDAQVIMATHSPILMATPGADLRRITHRGIAPYDWRDTDHFRLYQSFATDPEDFLKRALAGDWDGLA